MSRKRSRTRRANGRPGRALPGAQRLARQHDLTMARIKRWRGVGLMLGLVPLVGLTACDIGLSIACLPREVYLGIWAAVVGAVVGLSIRLVLERRRYQRHSPHG